MSNNSTIAAVGGGVVAIVVAIVVAVVMFSGVSENPEPMNNLVEETNQDIAELQETKIKVFASFYPYYEFTKNVAGDVAIVEQFLPPGVETHGWEPRPQEIQSLSEANVFVYNGLGMEPYLENIIDSGEFDNVVFVKASEGVELITPEEGHDEHGHAGEFAEEIEEVVEEFEHGHMTESQAIEKVEEILHEHEGDGHDHGNESIEKIEAVLHEIEDGHMTPDEGFEEIHHIVSDIEEGHDEHKDEGHDEHGHAGEFAEEIEEVVEEFEHGHMTESQAIEKVEEILHEHEGDGHDHGNESIEKIEAVLHEIEDGHMTPDEGFEEIHHIVSDIEEGHDEHKDEGHDEHEGDGHDGHDHDFEFDPHIWLDPILVKQQVNAIRDGLIQADPQNKEQYEANAMAYNKKLDELDMKIKSSISSCNKNTFVPHHNAFTYLAERYDLEVMALGFLAPRAEATAAEIAEFVDFVRDNDIKVIFYEEIVDPRLAEIIADEAGAELMIFSPMEAIPLDELDKNVSYIEKMEQNLDALVVALECR